MQLAPLLPTCRPHMAQWTSYVLGHSSRGGLGALKPTSLLTVLFHLVWQQPTTEALRDTHRWASSFARRETRAVLRSRFAGRRNSRIPPDPTPQFTFKFISRTGPKFDFLYYILNKYLQLVLNIASLTLRSVVVNTRTTRFNIQQFYVCKLDWSHFT
jgi:hypothetical protein